FFTSAHFILGILPFTTLVALFTVSLGFLSLHDIQFETFSALMNVSEDSRFPLAMVAVEPKINIDVKAAIAKLFILVPL
ncbi:MAG: hypothetical protein OEW97_05900, partial [Gammaproteobacteria bacterium]|nr:hypothetical protein [Gammaproteobacteria bacterium]